MDDKFEDKKFEYDNIIDILLKDTGIPKDFINGDIKSTKSPEEYISKLYKLGFSYPKMKENR